MNHRYKVQKDDIWSKTRAIRCDFSTLMRRKFWDCVSTETVLRYSTVTLHVTKDFAKMETKS